MDIELLKTFLEVKNTRHFGKAAENLYLTQAAVSSRIKQLERILGLQLFTRYRNNLQLTAAGDRLISHAETIIIAWERAQSDVSLKNNQKTILALGATSGLWDLILQDSLIKIHQELPELALRAESYGPDFLIRRLMERTLDFALIYEPAKLTDLISVQVAQAELVLITTEKEQSIEEALNHSYVSVDWGTAFDITHAQFFQNLNPPVLHTTLAKIALEFILQQGGSAYLPLQLVEPYLNTQLHQIEPAPVINRPIYACYHSDNLYGDTIAKIIKIITDIHKEE